MIYLLVPPRNRLIALAAVGVILLIASGFSRELQAANSRQLSFVVEPFEKDTQEPPTSEQISSAQHALEHLDEQAREFEIEGHTTTTDFQKAAALVQVTSNLSARGLRVEVKIYNKSTDTWYPVTTRLFDVVERQKLKSELAVRILPQTIIRLLELAQPAQQPVMFADCLFPGQGSAASMQQAARLLSSSYPHSLSAKNRLKQRFSIVRLVPTVEPRFYRWWCIESEEVQRRAMRDDTVQVQGFFEQSDKAAKPELFMVLSRRSGPQTGSIIVEDDRKITLQRIADMVETLANDN
jgi:hypothetical protein